MDRRKATAEGLASHLTMGREAHGWKNNETWAVWTAWDSDRETLGQVATVLNNLEVDVNHEDAAVLLAGRLEWMFGVLVPPAGVPDRKGPLSALGSLLWEARQRIDWLGIAGGFLDRIRAAPDSPPPRSSSTREGRYDITP